ncbi:MAG: hypothetical protein ACRD2G_06680 [Terriglobia bacterium]
MTNTGKIARLPHVVREELNQRLLDNQPAEPILSWLNALYEVQRVLIQQFAGTPLTPQNLSEWRTGGFVEWRLKKEVHADTRDLEQTAGTINKSSTRQVSENLATVLAGRYATLLNHWDGKVTPVFNQELRALSHLCHDVAVLRKGDHNAARLALAQEQAAAKRKKTDAELDQLIEARLADPAYRARVLQKYAPATPSDPIQPNPAQSPASPSDFGPETLDSGHSSPVAPNPTKSTPEPGHPAQPVASQTAPSDPIQPNPAGFGRREAQPCRREASACGVR